MTPQETNQHLTQLLIKLEACRKLEHGGMVSDEEIQALSETVNPPERAIDAGGGQMIEETPIE